MKPSLVSTLALATLLAAARLVAQPSASPAPVPETPAGGELTYERVRALAADRFLALAGAQWEAKDFGAAIYFGGLGGRVLAELLPADDPKLDEADARNAAAARMLLAEKNNPASQAIVADTRELEAAEARGDPYAAHELAMRYSYGLAGLAPNLERAIDLFLVSAAEGRPDSIFELGLALRRRRLQSRLEAFWGREGPVDLPGEPLGDVDPREFQVMNDAYVKGHAGAKAFVGLGLVEQGLAAEGADAQKTTDQGWGLLRGSAQTGNAWGQYLLAEALAQGFGVGSNRSLALEWAERAAAQGLREGQSLRAQLALPVPPEVSDPGSSGAPPSPPIPDADSPERDAWVDLYCSAAQGYAPACFRLGKRLALGQGIAAELDAGLDWIEQASEAGYMPATQALLEIRR